MDRFVTNRSIRDESIHVEGIAKLFRQFCTEYPKIVDDEFKAAIYEMARQSVKLEDKFVQLTYKMGAPEGLEASDVKIFTSDASSPSGAPILYVN